MKSETLRSLGMGFRGQLALSSAVLLGMSVLGYAWLGSSAAWGTLWVLLGAVAVGCLVRSCGIQSG